MTTTTLPDARLSEPVSTGRRVFSAYTPSGRFTLGNLLGALRPAATTVGSASCVFAIADLHAMTTAHDPATVRERTLENAMLAIASGLDPERCVLFIQSHVTAHAELAFLLECTGYYGEFRRMIQFKEKAERQENVRLSLLTYPALMAADILLYQATEVPVGADQTQHVELTRDLAERFNRSYGQVFTMPRAVHPPTAARVMDFADPLAKMSKSSGSPGTVYLLDPPSVVRRKIMRAVTDSGQEVTYDPAGKPGVSNLLAVLSACTGTPIGNLAYGSYGALKRDVADAVIAVLEPLQAAYDALEVGDVRALLADGASTASSLAAPTLNDAKRAIGLVM